MRILIGLLIVVASIHAFAADCESRLITRAYAEVAKKALLAKALTFEDVDALARSEVPYNPFRSYTPVSENASFARYFDLTLTRVQDAGVWRNIRAELRALLEEQGRDRETVQSASENAAPIFNPHFVIGQPGMLTREQLLEIKVLKSGEVIFTSENQNGDIEFHSLPDRSPLLRKTRFNSTNFSLSENAQGQPTMLTMEVSVSTKMQDLWDRIRWPGLGRYNMVETNLRDGTVKKTLRYAKDVAANKLLPPNSFLTTLLSNANGEQATMRNRGKVLDGETYLVFEKWLGDHYEPAASLKGGANRRADRLTYSAAYGIDGKFSAVEWSHTQLRYFPTFLGESVMALPIEISGVILFAEVYATPGGRRLLAVASGFQGMKKIEVYAPEESTKPIFAANYDGDMPDFRLYFFRHQGRTFIAGASKDRFIDFYEPEASENRVFRMQLEPNSQCWGAFQGKDDQVYLMIKRDGFRGDLDFFTLFNRT